MTGVWTLAIDFGTTATVAAALDDRGERMVGIAGETSVPSTVAWVNGRLVVGAEAERHRIFQPGAAALHPKRAVGRRPTLLLGDVAVPTSEAVGALLEVVAHAAVGEAQGWQPSKVVLTHPVRWSSTQIDGLLEAARLAGLSDPSWVSEPVAAAVHFGVDRLEEGGCIAIYDLGGGTFDTAVLRRVGDDLELAGPPGGIETIGGDNFDSRLRNTVIDRIEARSTTWASELQTSDDPVWRRALAELTIESRRVKETLSHRTTGDVVLPAPMSGEVRITRPELEELVRDDLDATVRELAVTVEAAGLAPEDLVATFVTGGASRTPLVTRLLHDALGASPTTLDDPKTVVALGAARWATIPSSHRRTAPDDTESTDSDERDSPPPETEVAPAPPTVTTTSADPTRRAGVWMIAAAIVLAIVAVVAVVVVSRSSGSSGPATVSVAGAPTGLTFTDGAAWASVDDAGAVSRIDAGSNQVSADVAVGSSPLGVTHADGAVWVVDEDANTVVRVDTGTMTVATTISVGKRPLAVSEGEGSVWVANYDDNSVSRIDPDTNAVVATIPVGRGPSAIAVGEGAVWVANGDDATVSKVDPDANAQQLTLPVGDQPLAIAVGGGSVWVASFGTGAVAYIDPDRNEVAGTVAVGQGPAALAVDGSDVWVANSQADSVMRIDTAELRVAGTKGTGRGPAALAIGAGSLWVANGVDKTVSRLPLD